jgi:GNAT superfamily N-acetyltransferase
MTTIIEELRPADLEGPDLKATVELLRRSDQERTPEDPPKPDEVYERMVTTPSPDARLFFWGAKTDGTLVGGAYLQLPDRDNTQMGWAGLIVSPGARGHGLGRKLLRKLVERAAAEGRTAIAGDTSDRVPAGGAFAASLGANPGLAMHTNQLDVRSLDPKTIRWWIDASRAKADGYHVTWIDWSAADDPTVAQVAQSYEAINDMPKGEMSFEAEHWDVQRVRERSAHLAAMGLVVWTAIAIHDTTGTGVGYTELVLTPQSPEIVQQSGTAVTPAHRGHALGMWLKAANLERLLREWPKARFIRTNNAKVNEAMLRINTEIGFKPAWSTTLWQADVAKLLTELA